jgi:hypothetical protein
MLEEYPPEFARGILNSAFLNENLPDTTLFTSFKENGREDGYAELSINWADNKNAITILKDQKKKESEIPQYGCGVGLFSTDELKRLCRLNPYFKDALSYERKPIEGNEFHGNLLLIEEINKKNKNRRNMIAATIATNCFLRII